MMKALQRCWLSDSFNLANSHCAFLLTIPNSVSTVCTAERLQIYDKSRSFGNCEMLSSRQDLKCISRDTANLIYAAKKIQVRLALKFKFRIQELSLWGLFDFGLLFCSNFWDVVKLWKPFSHDNLAHLQRSYFSLQMYDFSGSWLWLSRHMLLKKFFS